METSPNRFLDFEIDALTNSVVNVRTGQEHGTLVSPIQPKDLGMTLKRDGWVFNWRLECRNPMKRVYKLCTLDDPNVIQGLVSLEIKEDHVFMHLVESAPSNRGTSKIYEGVLGNLVAFGCKLSDEQGFEGNLAFLSKTRLIEHYRKTLNAFHAGRGLMILESHAARSLIVRYFKDI